MRLLASILLTVLASFGIVVTGGAGPALACSCAFQGIPEYVGYADEVFVGTLVDIEHPPRRIIMSSTDPVTYTVAVEAVYQGDVGTVAVFESAMSGASCGLEGMVVDRRYLVFTTTQGRGREASSCGGTAPATPRRLDAVHGLLGDPTTPSDAAGGEVSREAVRTAVDDDTAPAGSSTWVAGAALSATAALLAVGLRLRRRRADWG